MQPSQAAFLRGIRAEIPLLIGVFPFGLIYGASALAAGLTPAAAQTMSSVVFAGSAQFIAVALLQAGVPAAVVVLSILVINLRHVLYSASIAPYVKRLSAGWKATLSYLLTDEAYAATIVHYGEGGPSSHGHWFFLGAGAALWTVWQISTALGIFLGASIPSSWPLEFALPLTFIALIVPALSDRPSVLAAASAGVVAILAHGLPYQLGLIVAALSGIAIGMLAEARQ